MNRYYIAYGSNLSVEQMAYRCPDATVEGKADLRGWRLLFRLHATIEPEQGWTVPALIWGISASDEASLDRYEGFPDYYRKETLKVTMTDLDGENPRETEAMVYLMNRNPGLISPQKFYYDIIEEGYDRFGFDRSILERAFEDAITEEMCL